MRLALLVVSGAGAGCCELRLFDLAWQAAGYCWGIVVFLTSTFQTKGDASCDG